MDLDWNRKGGIHSNQHDDTLNLPGRRNMRVMEVRKYDKNTITSAKETGMDNDQS